MLTAQVTPKLTDFQARNIMDLVEKSRPESRSQRERGYGVTSQLYTRGGGTRSAAIG